jgi:heat shock protein HtpX
MIPHLPGFFVLLSLLLVGPSMPLGLTIDALAAGVAVAFALGRSYRGRTYVLLSLLILMFVQSILALTIGFTHPTLPPPPETHPASQLWPIFSALIAVNSGLIAVGALAAGCAALFFEFGKSRFGISTTLPQFSFETATPEVQNMVKRLSDVAGIVPPEALIVDSGVPSAFTIRADRRYSLAVSVGLLESLDSAEVEACIAHEIAHLKNRDFRVRSIATLAKLALFARPPSYFLEPAIYRAREFLADETAARMIGGPRALISALSKLSESTTIALVSASVTTCNLTGTGRLREFFGKHPSLKSRITVLQEMNWD